MDASMVDERKRMGRPLLPARCAKEERKRPPVLARSAHATAAAAPRPGDASSSSSSSIPLASAPAPASPAHPPLLAGDSATSPASPLGAAAAAPMTLVVPGQQQQQQQQQQKQQRQEEEKEKEGNVAEIHNANDGGGGGGSLHTPPTPATNAAAAAAAVPPPPPTTTATTSTPASAAGRPVRSAQEEEEEKGSDGDGDDNKGETSPPTPMGGGGDGGTVRLAPNDFVGRERELKSIYDFVDGHHPNRKGRSGAATNLVVLLYGLPVVGKSALARRLMALFSDRYPDFHFEINMKGVSSGYISLTDAMVGVIRSVHPTLALPDNNLPIIKGIYESCFKGRQCMLLIENVGSVEHITSLLPVTSKACLTVATSRKDIPLEIALGSETTLSVKLSAMTGEDAARLVRSLLPHASPGEAQELARLLGNLPLPIRLIGGVLRRKPNLTLAGMITKLQNNDAQVMEMLESSFGIAEEEYPPEVYEAMRCLCLFPATFDGCAAMALLGKSYEEAEDILGLLLEYSLLDFDVATGRYHMNDLVRSHTLRKALTADPRTLDGLRERFVRYFLSQLTVCRASLEQTGSAGLPTAATTSTGAGDMASTERATLLFTRERYNFEACAKFLRQSSSLAQTELGQQFAENYTAVNRGLDVALAAAASRGGEGRPQL